ncbi:Required for respiratory growth protein 9 mitochondrial, partial [Coemansia linderi]
SFEQLERLEEESLQRQAEEHAHEGSSLFADALPARDEDISIRTSQFVDSDALPTRSADGVPQGGLEGVTASNAGYSKNTIRAIHILDAACTPEREEPLSYQGVAGGARRGDAVKLFFELLVLKSKDFIDVQQVAPFEDILISPCPKLRRAAESISVTTTDDATALAAVAQVDAYIVPDKAGNRGWLEQRLTEEQQTSGANGRRSQARQVGYKSRRAPGESEGDAGFVKIERGKRAAETRGSKSSSKSQSGDAGDESEMTLTAKDLAAKAKWQQSGAAKSRMQDRLRDPSLAVWQRRKIELKLKLGSDKWEPEKKIATSSMEKIRLLNSEFPDVWTMQRLSEQFKVSQETVRRILKSKFRPSEQRTEKRELKRRSEMLAFKEKEKVPGDRTQSYNRSTASPSQSTEDGKGGIGM